VLTKPQERGRLSLKNPALLEIPYPDSAPIYRMTGVNSRLKDYGAA
jgi:hypothetical protein